MLLVCIVKWLVTVQMAGWLDSVSGVVASPRNPHDLLPDAGLLNPGAKLGVQIPTGLFANRLVFLSLLL
ncbi:hypothetical protein Ptr902_05514 [Pyrenophora tritici-repentis]|nr:hypothetical protein Ptr902_05514 [Pyrenophora tritici-repentis]